MPDGKQLNLLNPSLHVDQAVKVAMSQVVRDSGLSRPEALDRINDLAVANSVPLVNGNGKKLSMDTFEKWLNPRAVGHAPSLKALVVFCRALGTFLPLEALAAPLEAHVVDNKKKSLLDWAEAEMEIRRLRLRKKKIEDQL